MIRPPLPALLVVALACSSARAGDDVDAKCREMGKKLASAKLLTELAVKPFFAADDEVRRRFFKLYEEIPWNDEGRAAFAALASKRDPDEEVKVGAVEWLGRLTKTKSATKALGDAFLDKSPKVRAAAVAAVGAHRDPTWGPKLGKLLFDDTKELRLAAAKALGAQNDRKQTASIIAAYKKFGTKDDDDAVYGEALALLGETQISLEIATRCLKSRSFPARLAAVHAIEMIPSPEKTVPVLMENLILELRRSTTMDSTKPGWDVVYVTMCTELQRRTGQGNGNDATLWFDWWETVRTKYNAPAPAFDRALVTRWLDAYRAKNPGKVKE